MAVAATVFGVVILNESNGIACIVGVFCQAYAVESTPVAIVYSITDGVTDREVESCTCGNVVRLGAFNPCFHLVYIAVPIFADRKFRL